MSDQEAKNSDLVEIAKRNGDFRKNYGLITGAFLYLRSISAARGGSFWWNGLWYFAHFYFGAHLAQCASFQRAAHHCEPISDLS
jgi:hypothetical protein